MASGRNVPRSNRTPVKKYEVLVEFDYQDRHYIPGELLPLAEWQQEHILSALERRLIREEVREEAREEIREETVDELPSTPVGGEEVTYGTSGSA